MTNAHDAIDATLGDIERLRKGVAKGKSKQVTSAAELDLVRANIQSWLRTRRPVLLAFTSEDHLSSLDASFRDLLGATHHATLRSRYAEMFKAIKRFLTSLQVEKAVEFSISAHGTTATSDTQPSFAAIAGDAEMQKLLGNRWLECVGCVQHDLPLSATVMLGGLLEAVLLARVNQLQDKKPVFTSKAAPKDRKTGAALPLKEWGLSNYIDVANELGWISDTYKDVGSVLRDYRNYIHPLKEYQHKQSLTATDAKVLWEIGKSILRQLL